MIGPAKKTQSIIDSQSVRDFWPGGDFRWRGRVQNGKVERANRALYPVAISLRRNELSTMAFWKRKKNWEDEYDEYYAQDRRAERGKAPGKLRFLPHVLLLGFFAALSLGGAGLVSGPTMVEKLLTELATPVGVVWLGLIGLVYFCVLLRQTWPAVLGFLLWLTLTVGGNQFVAGGLAGILEAPYQDINVFELEPFETIVVLGGGTSTTRGGQSQLGSSGDRVALAARLYHAQQVKRLICTGSQTFRSTPEDLHPREETAEVLLGLGVPKESVLQIRGENTSQEMDNLKKWLDKNENKGRVGLLTSAWHLPRAIRLAQDRGLDVHPVPANFLAIPYAPTPNLIVPGSDDLSTTGRMIKEFLARLVGR